MNNFNIKRNLSMLADFYELTMSAGYFENNMKDTIAYFDMFFRKVPDNGGFAIMAGLEQVIEYINNLSFNENDIDYLRSTNLFSEQFLEYLLNFTFTCDVWAVEEGTPIFPQEPIVTVKGPIIEAQLIETMLLLSINHQSLIATKAVRICTAARDKSVLEFGSRRAQGADAALYGARASYIGGCDGTACVLAGKQLGIPVFGTMAHSWVQIFDTEYEAFKTYATQYPNDCTLLVDTYNTLNSGVPNAIKVFKEILEPLGCRPKGIRIDSGDITYLSKKARIMLDEAGFEDCKICASNSLDEYLIRDMFLQNAKIDLFGIGERLITASSQPVFGGVYKLVAIEKNGERIPKIKISENVGKITIPEFKELYRLFDNETNRAIADVIALNDEIIDHTKPYEIFDPSYPWKRKTITNFTPVKLRKKIFENGKLVYDGLSLDEIKIRCNVQVNLLWEEVRRFENPHNYYIDLSQKLYNVRETLLNDNKI